MPCVCVLVHPERHEVASGRSGFQVWCAYGSGDGRLRAWLLPPGNGGECSRAAPLRSGDSSPHGRAHALLSGSRRAFVLTRFHLRARFACVARTRPLRSTCAHSQRAHVPPSLPTSLPSFYVVWMVSRTSAPASRVLPLRDSAPRVGDVTRPSVGHGAYRHTTRRMPVGDATHAHGHRFAAYPYPRARSHVPCHFPIEHTSSSLHWSDRSPIVMESTGRERHRD